MVWLAPNQLLRCAQYDIDKKVRPPRLGRDYRMSRFLRSHFHVHRGEVALCRGWITRRELPWYILKPPRLTSARGERRYASKSEFSFSTAESTGGSDPRCRPGA